MYFTTAIVSQQPGLYFDRFCADLGQLGIHLVEVVIYKLST